MPKTLLLADDSITIQKMVAITFANEDYAVTVVDNGEDLIARARTMRPDVVLADVVMPRKNGYEVCEALKGETVISLPSCRDFRRNCPAWYCLRLSPLPGFPPHEYWSCYGGQCLDRSGAVSD